MRALLRRSIDEKVVLEMIYHSLSGKITQRKIQVYELRGQYILAYCHLRRQTRLFKIDHILSALPDKSRYRLKRHA